MLNSIHNIALNKALSKLPGSENAAKTGPVDFKSILTDAKLRVMQALSKSFAGETEGAVEWNPFQGHQWILNWMSRNSGLKESTANEFARRRIGAVYQTETPRLPGNVSLNQKGSIRDQVFQAARKHGIPENFFEKLIRLESGFNPSAKSPKGAMGLGQLMPATARELGLRTTGEPSAGSVWDPASNLDASARYLHRLHRLYLGKGIEEREAWKFAAGAYNAGMGNIQKSIDRVGASIPLTWQNVAARLPQVTGKASRETLRYVERLGV